VKQIGAALNDAYKEQCLCSGSEGSFDLKDDKFYKQALENLRDSVMKGGRYRCCKLHILHFLPLGCQPALFLH